MCSFLLTSVGCRNRASKQKASELNLRIAWLRLLQKSGGVDLHLAALGDDKFSLDLSGLSLNIGGKHAPVDGQVDDGV